MPLEHEKLTERIIGAAIEVHKRLGPGFLESIYENALVVELRKREDGVGDVDKVKTGKMTFGSDERAR